MKYHVVIEGRAFEVEVGPGGRVWVNRQPLHVDLEDIDGPAHCSLLVDHQSYETYIEAEEKGGYQVAVAGRSYQTRLVAATQPPAKTARPQAGDEAAEVSSPLPGLLVEVKVTEGQWVREGDVVAVLESMKMHLELRSPRSGVVCNLRASEGCEVAQGETLAVIAHESPAEQFCHPPRHPPEPAGPGSP